MKRSIYVAVLLGLAACNRSYANEIEGFRLGMTTEQVVRVAGENGYTLSNPTKDGSKWTSYVLMTGTKGDYRPGLNVSFCGNVLSSVGKSYESNLHEFANLVTQWTQALGAPDDVKASQRFMEGTPFSDLNYTWTGTNNVKRSLGFFQWGNRTPQVSYSYWYIDHPCRR